MANVTEALAAGWECLQRGDLPRAEQIYRHVVAADDSIAQAWYLLGVVSQLQRKLAEALASYQEALRLDPAHAEASNNLGLALFDQGKTAEALARYRAAIRLRPEYADAHNNLGNALQDQGDLDDAVACYRAAIRLRPDYADAHHNLGNVLRAQGKPAESEACYGAALRLNPEHAQAHLSRAMLRLQTGDFVRAWPEFEWRWRCPEFPAPRFSQPLWDGSPLKDRTVLLYADHGMGDALHFIRYAPLVRERVGRVVLACPRPLARLLECVRGVDEVRVEGDPLPEFSAFAPLMSLPGIFGTTLETIPAEVPYLEADEALVAHWRREFGLERAPLGCVGSAVRTVFDSAPAPDGPHSGPYENHRIGIVWQGNPKYRKDRDRSFRLEQLEPVARLAGVRLFSLQRGPGTEQIAAVADRFPVADLGSRLGDFLDDAAVMRSFDLVIAPDTSIAHLAGGLGVPVWLALSTDPDWRWMLDRDDSPWYPTMRLFRQRRRGDWDEVFARITAALAERLQAGGPGSFPIPQPA